jgi:hypothetical protein
MMHHIIIIAGYGQIVNHHTGASHPPSTGRRKASIDPRQSQHFVQPSYPRARVRSPSMVTLRPRKPQKKEAAHHVAKKASSVKPQQKKPPPKEGNEAKGTKTTSSAKTPGKVITKEDSKAR